MKFTSTLFVIAFVSSVAAQTKEKKLRKLMGPYRPTRLGECEADCDTNRDCQAGMVCASNNKAFLESNRLDGRKAYCGNVGGKFAEVCFDPTKVETLLTECATDCDSDNDCQADLVCASDHRDVLQEWGCDIRKAYCGDVGEKNAEVCFELSRI